MTEATINDAKKTLRGALEDIEDSETRYKIRTALQFLEVLKYQEEELVKIVEGECEPDDQEVFKRLQELGYLE